MSTGRPRTDETIFAGPERKDADSLSSSGNGSLDGDRVTSERELSAVRDAVKFCAVGTEKPHEGGNQADRKSVV